MKCRYCGKYGFAQPLPRCAYCETPVPWERPWTIKFLGGYLGGTTQKHKELLPTIEVPVHLSNSFTADGPFPRPSQHMYGRDTYRRETVDSFNRTAIYRHIRPEYEKENYKLRQEIASLKAKADQSEKVLEAMAELHGYLSR